MTFLPLLLIISFSFTACLDESPDLECAQDYGSFPRETRGSRRKLQSYPRNTKNVSLLLKQVKRVVSYEEIILHKVKDKIYVKEESMDAANVTLRERVPQVLKLRYNMTDIHFRDRNPRNLTLMLDNNKIYVSIGLLMDRVVDGKPASVWVCSNVEFELWEAEEKRLDFYYSRYSGVETYDYLRFKKLPNAEDRKYRDLKDKQKYRRG